MKLFLLIVCLLINGLTAIDFTTIGQKEIVDYIKNRADLLYGTKLSERNLQDLLSNAVFTGLEEEALIFAHGSSVNSDLDLDQLPGGLSALVASVDRSGSVPLKIFLTSDTLGTTNIALDQSTTTKSSSSKSSVGDFVVNCLKQDSFDSTSLDGSITISLGGATDSHNLTLNKTIYLAAEVNVTSLGSNWEPTSSLLTDEGKLLSLLDSREGSMYVITYESLIRETIQADEGDLFGGLKSSGKVLAVVNSNGLVSLSGRTISGKIEATWENEAEELVDNFLSLNGSKSRKSMISDMTKAKSSKSLINSPSVSNEIESIENWVNAKIGKKSTNIHFGNYGHGSSRDANRWGSGHEHRHGGYRGDNNRDHHRRDNYRNQRADWKPSSTDGSTWPSWRSFWEFGYGYRYGWNAWDQLKRVVEDFESALDFDFDKDWQQNRNEHKSPSTTPKPVMTSKKPKVTSTTTPKPISTFEPVTTVKVEPEIEVTTVKSSTQSEYKESTQSTIEPEEKPDLSEPNFNNLPKGTTISLWSSRIV
ncbi:uncharacterized protein LOC128396202 [Panonychus citri]|uniref:uncharacterized protein LOC128396202 n=1 Tax=Panonychus citri TaxID=50023 RepID=UPI0023079FB1|nr:uncharacterized protein LOC128396202 [Panonychus citri]